MKSEDEENYAGDLRKNIVILMERLTYSGRYRTQPYKHQTEAADEHQRIQHHAPE
jgi:hypothetical protein